MKDKRLNKIKQHFEIFINGQKFKIISFEIKENERCLSIKTKIHGQNFPQNGEVVITIPSKNTSYNLSISFESVYNTPSIEHWEYIII